MLMSSEAPKGTALPLQVTLPAPSRPRRRLPWLAGALLLVLAMPLALPAPAPLVIAPQVAAPVGVMALARLMPEGDLIRVAPPHGAGDARLAELRVSVGDRVDAGAVLAILDNAPSLDAAVLSAEAQVASRDAALVQAREAVCIARLEAAAALAEAEIAAETAIARRDRAAALAERGITATAARDDLDAIAAQAAQAVVRAAATLERWQGDSATHPDILAAASAVEAARIEAARARTDRARAAGMQKASLYHHFPSKEALFIACVTEGYADALRRLEAIRADRALSDIERLRSAMEEIYRVNLSEPVGRMAPMIAEVAPNIPEVARAFHGGFINRHYELIAGILDDGIAHGSFAPLETLGLRQMIFGPVIFLAMEREMTAGFPDRDALNPVERIRESHIDLILRLLCGPDRG